MLVVKATKEVKIQKVIVPKRMIYRGILYRITDINRKYIIREYVVKLLNDKILFVYIDALHPNSDPTTNKFCIPHQLRQLNFNPETKKFLENTFNVFNVDNCYFTPWGEIKYEKANQ